jgi:hypothetical protein
VRNYNYVPHKGLQRWLKHLWTKKVILLLCRFINSEASWRGTFGHLIRTASAENCFFLQDLRRRSIVPTEAFWRIHLCANRPGPSCGPSTTPRWAPDRNCAKLKFLLWTVQRREQHRPGPISHYPASGVDRPPVRNQKKPEGAKFSKKEL